MNESGAQITDLHLLDEAAGRELNRTDSTLLVVMAREYAEAIPNKCVRDHAAKIAKHSRAVRELLAEAPSELEPFKALVHPDLLERLEGYAECVGERRASRMGPGQRPGSEDLMLEHIALLALDAWRNAGGSGLGVWYDDYEQARRGPVLNLVRAALQNAGAKIPSGHTIQNAILAGDQSRTPDQ